VSTTHAMHTTARWLTPSMKRHLLGHMRPTHARRWLHTPHPSLEHKTPLTFAMAGHEDAVVRVLQRDVANEALET